MFTGLIEELGTVVDLTSCGTSLCLKIKAEGLFRNRGEEDNSSLKIPQNGLKIGDSIAVNGVCLTVEKLEPPYFEVTAVQETLRKTTLGSLTIGVRTNLEQAATIETRLGGHLVQGHVDTTARIAAVQDMNGSWEFEFEIPNMSDHVSMTDHPSMSAHASMSEHADRFARYLIPKGSIALDGISLTIADVIPASQGQEHRTTIKVAIIPHTYSHTNLQFLNVGGTVNVEFDIVAKMVEQFVKPYSGSPA